MLQVEQPLQSTFSVAALLADKASAAALLPPTPQPSDSEEDEHQPPRKRQRQLEHCELAKVSLHSLAPLNLLSLGLI